MKKLVKNVEPKSPFVLVRNVNENLERVFHFEEGKMKNKRKNNMNLCVGMVQSSNLLKFIMTFANFNIFIF